MSYNTNMIVLLHDMFVVDTLNIKMRGYLLFYDEWFNRYDQICIEDSSNFKFKYMSFFENLS